MEVALAEVDRCIPELLLQLLEPLPSVTSERRELALAVALHNGKAGLLEPVDVLKEREKEREKERKRERERESEGERERERERERKREREQTFSNVSAPAQHPTNSLEYGLFRIFTSGIFRQMRVWIPIIVLKSQWPSTSKLNR